MSEKSKRTVQLLAKVKPRWETPDTTEDRTLMELALLCVLGRSLTRAQASSTLKALRAAYPDWNELRISQVQEFLGLVKHRDAETRLAVAKTVREFLNEIFWKNHGFDLEYLREDPQTAARFLNELPYLGAGAGHYLLWVANGKDVAVSPPLIRTLDRLGLIARTSSLRKAQEAIDAFVPEKQRESFSVSVGEVVEHWCDARKPICWECPLVEDCANGKKVRKDWKVQQQRLDVQRKKELARQAALEKREEARRQREEARRKKEAEAEARKLQREKERKRKESARKLAADAKRRAKAKAKAKKEEEARKKAGAQSTKKKASKQTARKTTKQKATTSKSAKKATRKQATPKKAARKKTSSKQTGSKKTGSKRTGTKSGARKATRSKATGRRAR